MALGEVPSAPDAGADTSTDTPAPPEETTSLVVPDVSAQSKQESVPEPEQTSQQEQTSAPEQTSADERLPAPEQSSDPDQKSQPEQTSEPEQKPESQQKALRSAPTSAPALRWTLVDGNGGLVTGATVTVQGPRDDAVADQGDDEQWADAAAATVEDNTGQSGYTGADLDPTPGAFQVEQFTDADAAAVRLGADYRIRPAEATGFTVGDSADWTDLSAQAGATQQATEIELTPLVVKRNAAVAPLDAIITPFASDTTADIIVRKRILANPSQVTAQPSTNIGTNYDYTVGTVFRLYENRSNNTVGDATDYTCTVAAGGECTITVDGVDRRGANYNERFWVVEEAPVLGSPAALNTYINSDLYVGDYTGPADLRRLVGLTKQLTANQTTYMPMTSGVSGSGYTNISNSELPGTNATPAEAGSFGAVAGSYNNPDIVAKCEASPLRIGIIIDQSESITGSQWTTLRTALVGDNNSTTNSSVLGLLRDEGASASILGFGSNISYPNGWHLGNSSGPVSLSGASNSTLRGYVPSNRPTSGANTTNWDSALSAFQGNASSYDMILFVTDGAPNYILNGSSVSSYNVTLRSLEAPIYAANSLKKDGVRVVAVGVGGGAAGSAVAKNLRAVSGENAGSDYLQGDWDGLKQILSNIVKSATCQVPVEVSKSLEHANGTTTELEAGWDFTAALGAATPGVSLNGTATQTTASGDTGRARWTVRFTSPQDQTAELTLTENPSGHDGWTLDSVACTLNGQSLTTTVSGTSVTISGLKPNSGLLSCVFTNKEATPATVTVNKQWVINGQNPVVNGDQPEGMSATLSLDPEGSGVGDVDWGKTRTGFVVGDEIEIAETTTFDPTKVAGCVLTGSTIAGPGITGSVALDDEGYDATLTAASNAYTVTNTVQCQQLMLVKTVENQYGGTATADDWDGGLFAQRGTNPQLVFDSGESQYVTDGDYVLSEADKDGYSQTDLSCTGGTLTGSTVTIAAGANVVCTFTNADDPGSVTWTKTAEDETTLLGGSEWTLTGPGMTSGETVTDCVETDAAQCTGLDQDPEAGKFLVEDLHWGDYTLVESKAPLGYVLDTAEHEFTISGAALTASVGAIVNTLGTPPNLPLTGGISADFYYLFGLSVLLLAFALLARRMWLRRRASAAEAR